jgi:hypothetical protein
MLAAGRNVTKPLDWLQSVAKPDGSFTNAENTSNANSTGLAAQALAAGGRDAATSVRWLIGKQLGCTAPPARRGAITFDGTYDGGDPVLATAQALPGVIGAPLTTLTAAGAEADAPVLACAAPPSASPTPAVTSPARAPATTTPAGNAAPQPGLAATNGVSGSAVRLLAGLGVGLVLTGSAVILLARRRA